MARQRSIQISIQTMSVESQRLIFITREKLQLLNKAIMDKTRDQSWVSKMQLKLSRERQVSKTKQLIWESTSTRIKVEISKERKFHSKLNKIILSHKIWSNLRTYQMDSLEEQLQEHRVLKNQLVIWVTTMEQALALPDKAIIMLISTPKTENYLLKTINTRWNILKLVTVISLQIVAMVLLLIHQLLWATLTKVLWSRTSPSQTVALEAH